MAYPSYPARKKSPDIMFHPLLFTAKKHITYLHQRSGWKPLCLHPNCFGGADFAEKTILGPEFSQFLPVKSIEPFKKNSVPFHFTSWLLGFCIMGYHNPKNKLGGLYKSIINQPGQF